MTEENKDPPPPKLRLSNKPKEPEAENQAKADESPEPKADLQLKRPKEAAPHEQTPAVEEKKTEASHPDLQLKRPHLEAPGQDGEAKKPTSPVETATQMDGPSAKTSGERPFDPENPFAGIEIKKPKVKRQPPELPSKPAPVENDGSGRKVEEAIEQIGDDNKSHNILTSIIVIVILLALLGGSGYGLYYLLRSPAESAKATAASEEMEPEATSNEAEEKSGNPPDGPIAKARAAVTKKENSGSTLEEVTASTAETKPDEPQAEDKLEAEPAEPSVTTTEVNTEAPTPSIDSSQTNLVSEFLQSAHIGGVRTGDRPKLLLNGKSYNQGDLVDADTGLRFIGFRDKKLAFRDAQGVVYIKSF